VKTAPYTAAVWELVTVDTTGGSVAVTLPSGASVGDVVAVRRADASANTLTVQRSGSDVISSGTTTATSTTITLQDSVQEFVSSGSGTWTVVGGHRSLAALDSRYVTSAVASVTYAALGLAGKQTYDSQDAIALRRFRYALGGRNAAPVDILHVGDSITMGYRASSLANRWPSIMRDHLRARFPTTGITGGGFGYVPARTISNYTAPFGDNIVTALNGGTNVFGLDGTDLQIGAGNSATFVFTGTGADILTTTYSGGGTYTYTIDGGAASSAVPTTKTGANEYGTITTQIRGLSSASHTLVISRASGSVFLEGIMVYDGDESKGIRSTVAALAGSYSGDWSTRATTYWPKYISQIQPGRRRHSEGELHRHPVLRAPAGVGHHRQRDAAGAVVELRHRALRDRRRGHRRRRVRPRPPEADQHRRGGHGRWDAARLHAPGRRREPLPG
jgi:hypothetical protein